MPYTMDDFQRDYLKKHFLELSHDERLEVLGELSPEEQVQVFERLTPDRIQKVLDRLDKLRKQALLKSVPLDALLAALWAYQVPVDVDRPESRKPAKSRGSRRKK